MALSTPAKAGNGGGNAQKGPRERCPKGSRLAAVVAVIDLGTHMESYKNEEAKPKSLVALVFEVLDKKQSNGSPFVFAEPFTHSVNEKARLRKVVESCGYEVDASGFDVRKLLGKTLRLRIDHGDNGKQGEERREYADVGSYDAPLDEELTPDGKIAKTQFQPFLYEDAGREDYVECDWIPWIWGGNPRRRAPIGELIAESREGKARLAKRQPAGAGVGGGDDDDDAAF